MCFASGNNVHPACLPVEALLAECEVRRLRRSGPGGQHRNKVETAIQLLHKPSGITAEANERRRQSENHREAIFRLRVQLALQVRLGHEAEADWPKLSALWQSRCHQQRIRIREDHADFPALLAEVLDLLPLSGYDIKPIAEHLDCTPSQLIKFLQIEPKALVLVNRERIARGLQSLK